MIVDVAVLGAGAAGSAAASILAPHASVALIDRTVEPVWRIGETLPGAAKRPLAVIGAWESFRAAGHASSPVKVSRWGTDEPVTLDSFRDPDGVGWRLDRAVFEADLRDNACKRGADLVAPENIAALAKTKAGWSVPLSSGRQLEARLIIDASGRRSRLLQPFGQKRLSVDRLACVYQLVPAIGDADPSTYTEATAEGWWYTALLPGGMRIVAFHSDNDLPALKAVLNEGAVQVAQRIPGLQEAIGKVDPTRATEPKMCAANSGAGSAAGQGWLAAGDSALSLDPLSSQGLFNALVTGLEAGETALQLLGGQQDAQGPMHAYARRMGQIWQAYLQHHATYYGMERRWPMAPFWQRRLGQKG